MNRSNGSNGCSCLAIVLSIIVGVAAGVLFYYNLIPAAYTAAWFAFIFAAVALLFLIFILISCAMRSPIIHDCMCRHGRCILVAAVGTIFTAFAYIAMSTAYFYVDLVLVALIALFFTLLLAALASFICCLINNHCGCALS